jgi:hypothetical protein
MTITKCDYCKVNQCQRVQVEIERSFSTLGDFQIQYEYADICMPCLMKKINEYFQDEPEDKRQRFLKLLINAQNKAA